MLSIIATPIGNLGDITFRAIETLKTCDGIICEDTRVTGQLLKHLNINRNVGASQPVVSQSNHATPFLISFHGNTDPGKADVIVRYLKEGRHLALVSDAGTPGISDPGYVVVSRATEAGIPIEVIPGPSAFLAALSGSGLPINQFVYLGFLPLKKGRKTLIESFRDEERTIVFYESVHRIERTLMEIAAALKNQPDRPVVIARELTKMHEEFSRTTVGQLAAVAAGITKKGEFVIVIGPTP